MGDSAHIVGQFVATGTERQLAIDVSDWVRERMAADASSLTFMFAREIRFDGDVDAANFMRIRGPGGEGSAPALMLAMLPPAPDPGTLLWYGDGIRAGGSGRWSADGVNWWNGTSLQAWDPALTAVFPDVGGHVVIDAGVAAAGVRIDGPGYSFPAEALSATGAPRIEVSGGARLAIEAQERTWLLAAGQTLGGLGMVDGSAVFGSGATLAPGAMATTVATLSTVPEPATGALAAGVLAMALVIRRPRGGRTRPSALGSVSRLFRA